MPGFDYGQIIQLPNYAVRQTFPGATTGSALLSGEHYPVGTIGTTQDGRWFVFSQNGAVATVAGSIYTGPVLLTNHVNNTAAATAAGAVTVTFTQGATAITRNFYKGGVLTVDVSPGGGFSYALDANDAVASATSNTYSLAAGESVQVALTTTSRLSLVSNPHRNLVIAPTTTLAAAVAGVAVSVIPVNGFGWMQTKGNCAVLTDGTVIIGTTVVSPSTNTAGACVAQSTTTSTSVIQVVLGLVTRAAASAAFSTVNLSILV